MKKITKAQWLSITWCAFVVISGICLIILCIDSYNEEVAYREQARAEMRRLQEQVHETELYLQETKEYWSKVQHFLDGLNILPEQTVTYYAPYDSRGLCHNGNPNSTATGTKPKEGTMAVNPAVIPYGAEIMIVYKDGTVERGRAEDTGGMIRASRSKVDVFRWTHDEAMRDGKKEATVVWVKDGSVGLPGR
jgi:3D (Asp-Asp-Asp) domain-containing protein